MRSAGSKEEHAVVRGNRGGRPWGAIRADSDEARELAKFLRQRVDESGKTLADLETEVHLSKSQVGVYLGGTVPKPEFVTALIKATVPDPRLRERRQAEATKLLQAALHPQPRQTRTPMGNEGAAELAAARAQQVDTYDRLTRSLERQAELERAANNSAKLVMVLLSMIHTLNQRVDRLTNKRDQLRAQHHDTSDLHSVQRKLARAVEQEQRAKDELTRAEDKQRQAEELAARVQEQVHRLTDELNRLRANDPETTPHQQHPPHDHALVEPPVPAVPPEDPDGDDIDTALARASAVNDADDHTLLRISTELDDIDASEPTAVPDNTLDNAVTSGAQADGARSRSGLDDMEELTEQDQELDDLREQVGLDPADRPAEHLVIVSEHIADNGEAHQTTTVRDEVADDADNPLAKPAVATEDMFDLGLAVGQERSHKEAPDKASEPFELAAVADAPVARRSKLVLSGVAIVSLVGSAYGAGLILDSAEVPEGTTVLGIDIGGATKKAAVLRLDAALSKRVAAPLKVSVDGQDHELKPSAAGLAIDSEATVSKAAVRDYDPLSVIDSLFGGTRPRQPEIKVDAKKLTAALGALAPPGAKGQDGGIKFVAGKAVPVKGKPHKRINLPKAAVAVRDAYRARAETDQNKSIPLPILIRKPTIDDAEIQRALKEFANPAMSGLVTVRTDSATITFSPERSLPTFLSMKPVDGHLVDSYDRKVLRKLYGSFFEGVLIQRGDGSKTPVTVDDVIEALRGALRGKTVEERVVVIGANPQ